jgi:hypothetical protein
MRSSVRMALSAWRIMESAWAASADPLVGVDGGPRVRPGESLNGIAERVAGVELGGDDFHCEGGFGGILRQQVRDGGHGELFADGSGILRVVGRRGNCPAEFRADLAGEGVWDIGNAMHDVAVVLGRCAKRRILVS